MNKKLNNKKNKTKKIKEIKYRSEEQQEVIRFVIILISIFVIVGAIYGVSKFLIEDEDATEETETVSGEINYDLVTVGTMFNRNYDEYYVVAYKKTDASAILYSSIVNKYSNKDKALKVYFCDLDNSLNNEYYVGETGESNPNAKKMSDLALGKFTFLKIKDGKIVKYLEDIEEAKKELGV